MSHTQHHREAQRPVSCAVITVSDTRTPETDKSGRLIRERLETTGHTVGLYRIVEDQPDRIREQIEQLATDGTCEAVLLTGGTGLAPRDTTFEALEALFEKRLTGFGELFRSLSYDEIGPAAMLSRATAGTTGKMVIFSMPGSTGAVRLAMDRLILPELAHAVWLLKSG